MLLPKSLSFFPALEAALVPVVYLLMAFDVCALRGEKGSLSTSPLSLSPVDGVIVSEEQQLHIRFLIDGAQNSASCALSAPIAGPSCLLPPLECRRFLHQDGGFDGWQKRVGLGGLIGAGHDGKKIVD